MYRKPRYWEVDLIRGVAILMMVIFHIVFDLDFFSLFPVSAGNGFWRYFGYATASLFLMIAGLSFSISCARITGNLTPWQVHRKFLYRGAGIFAVGMLVTLGTWLYPGEGFVLFGILHLIGISIILAPFFYRFGISNIAIGVACILVGFVLNGITGPIWLLPIGIHPVSFWSVDYTPLFPWFGLFLIGVGAGSFLYPDGLRRIPVPEIPPVGSQLIIFSGRHSLFIYLVHQPVILLLLQILTGRIIAG